MNLHDKITAAVRALRAGDDATIIFCISAGELQGLPTPQPELQPTPQPAPQPELLTVKEVDPPAELLTIKEAARWLRLTERTIYRMIDDGRLSSSRMGREYRIHRESVEALLKPVNTKETHP